MLPSQPLGTVAGVELCIGALIGIGIGIVGSCGLSITGFLSFSGLHFFQLLLKASETHLGGIGLDIEVLRERSEIDLDSECEYVSKDQYTSPR